MTVLRLSLHRLTGDNYVHLNEWRITVPDLTGASQLLGREAWGGPNYHRNYLNWWYTRMPHAPGRAPDGRLQNWWPYLVDMNEYSESR